MTLDTRSGGAERQPDDTEEPINESLRSKERDNGIGESSPLPDDAGGDAPPERDILAELEDAVGRTLSDDLTAEATQLSGDDQDNSWRKGSA